VDSVVWGISRPGGRNARKETSARSLSGWFISGRYQAPEIKASCLTGI